METIVEILMRRDGLTREDAEALVEEAKEEFHYKLTLGEDCFYFCEEFFGLEPDYLMDLI